MLTESKHLYTYTHIHKYKYTHINFETKMNSDTTNTTTYFIIKSDKHTFTIVKVDGVSVASSLTGYLTDLVLFTWLFFLS